MVKGFDKLKPGDRFYVSVTRYEIKIESKEYFTGLRCEVMSQ